MTEGFLRVPEVARALGIPGAEVYRRIADGEIDARRGLDGLVYVPASTVGAGPTSSGPHKVIERVRSPERRRMLADVLSALTALGCRVVEPPAQRSDYVNIAAPGAAHRARVCSVNVTSSIRVEFQSDSFALAEELSLAHRFDRLPAGNKAAITPRGADDVAAVVTLAKAVLAARAAS